MIRIARPDELGAALGVWRRANVARGKAPGGARVARVREKLADAAALVVVAVDGGVVVGMALAEPGRDRDGGGAELPGLCHVSMVFVDPRRWGERIGQRLLDAVAEGAVARGHACLQVWTGERNERAVRLYHQAGFRPSGRRKLLGDGEPIVHLTRVLVPGGGSVDAVEEVQDALLE